MDTNEKCKVTSGLDCLSIYYKIVGFISTFLVIISLTGHAQLVFTLDASQAKEEIKSGHLKMGNPGPQGKKIEVNNRYLTLNGGAVIPVMGELQFSRAPREKWEEIILKMKAAGINIVATYAFWNHHEEIEGQFDWSGSKDLRYFLQLCKKHQLWAYPRIGPWCHGEVRNGGFPDWVLLKKNMVPRSNDPVYQNYVSRWYNQISGQMKGLLYKDGGPVIGIQMENEYGKAEQGESHILWLKETALLNGIDVPLYSVTGWGRGSVPQYEVVPMWGSYSDAPWNADLEKIITRFRFDTFRDNEEIGTDLLKKKGLYMSYNMYPYFTCEMGVGIMNTDHRRLIISPIDGLALITSKIGSGSNMIGYYIFAGGSNPHGILSSTEENKDETGYPNELPEISYDFQAAIKESGELAPSYYEIKKFHYFLNEFGDRIAPAISAIGQKSDDLKYAVRVDKNAGFLFGLYYGRGISSPEKTKVQFEIKLKDESLLFPRHAVNIPDSSIFAWPFNLNMDGILLKYAIALPICKIEQKDQAVWVFSQDVKNISPEFCFAASDVEKIENTNGLLTQENGRYIISGLHAGADCIISVYGKNGTNLKVLVLSKEESRHVWLFNNKGQKSFFISESNLYMDQDKLHVYGPSNNLKFQIIESSDLDFSVEGEKIKGEGNGLFTDYRYSCPKKEITLDLQPSKILDGATWLKTSIDSINKKNILFRRFFLKEFNLGNPSKIKSVKMYVASESTFQVQVNNNWVSQSISLSSLNEFDLTGYAQKGENTILLDFLAEEGNKAFASRIIVDYYNTDRIEFFSDFSWLTRVSYRYPSYLSKVDEFVVPDAVNERTALNQVTSDYTEYTLSLSADCLDGLNDAFLHLDYAGNKARCYINQTLVADDFNSNVPWHLGLKQLGNQIGIQKLKFLVFPMSKEYRIYFDNPPLPGEVGTAKIQNLKIIPEYGVDFEMKGQ